MALLVLVWRLLLIAAVTTTTGYAAAPLPPPPCRGDCSSTAPTINPPIGTIVAEVGNGDILFRVGDAHVNFIPLNVDILELWVPTLLQPSVYRNWTANITAQLQYNGVLEAATMYTWSPELIPDSPELFSSVLSTNILHGQLGSVGPMMNEFFFVNGYNLAQDIPTQAYQYALQSIAPYGAQVWGYPWFTNIRPLTVNQTTFARCKIKVPPSPSSPNGWAAGSFTYAAFSKMLIELSSSPCNVEVPFWNQESWTPYIIAPWLQSHNLGFINSDGTSAINTPAVINVFETEILPALLASPNMTCFWVNCSAPAMSTYLATPIGQWNKFQGWPLGQLSGQIPTTEPVGMAQITAAKPGSQPGIVQTSTPGTSGPGYDWFKTINANAEPMQQLLAADWLRFNGQLYEPPTSNATAPPVYTPLNLWYQAQKRLPISTKARADPAFVSLIAKTASLQITNQVFQKSASLFFPMASPTYEAEFVTNGVINGLLACMAILKQPVSYCTAQTETLMNYMNLRPCQGPADVEYVVLPSSLSSSSCDGGTLSYAQWNNSRVNSSCRVTDQSAMQVASVQTIPPRQLQNGDALILAPDTTSIVVAFISACIHFLAFVSAMSSADFYVDSMHRYGKTRRLINIEWRSMISAAAFAGVGIWIQLQLSFAILTLQANVCHVVGDATIRFWTGMMILQLVVNVGISIVAMVASHFAFRHMVFRAIAMRTKPSFDGVTIGGATTSHHQHQEQDASSKQHTSATATMTNSSDFHSEVEDDDDRQARVNAFLDILKDTNESWAVFLLSGAVQSANIVLGYWLNRMIVFNGISDVTISMPPADYVLIIDWLAGAFILGFIQRSMLRYGSARARYLVASIPACWTAFVQWINLELMTTFRFHQQTTQLLPSTTASATDAGLVVGALALVTVIVFLANGKRASLAESRHNLKIALQAFRTFIVKARMQLANAHYRMDVRESNFDQFPRPFILPLTHAEYAASRTLPINLKDKRDIAYRSVPGLEQLKRKPADIVSTTPLFKAKENTDMRIVIHNMLNHPLVGAAFHDKQTLEHGLENETFLRDTAKFRATYSSESTALMVGFCIALYWIRCVDNVDFDNYNSDENKRIAQEAVGIDPRVNISGAIQTRIFALLNAGKAPVTLFDEADLDIINNVLYPLRAPILSRPGNRFLFPPCPAANAGDHNNNNRGINATTAPEENKEYMTTIDMAYASRREPSSHIRMASSPVITALKADVSRVSPARSSRAIEQPLEVIDIPGAAAQT